MRIRLQIFASFFVLWAASAAAVPKPHVISFGKWTPAKWYVGSADIKALDLKIRALYVDTRLKEFTTGRRTMSPIACLWCGRCSA